MNTNRVIILQDEDLSESDTDLEFDCLINEKYVKKDIKNYIDLSKSDRATKTQHEQLPELHKVNTMHKQHAYIPPLFIANNCHITCHINVTYNE